MQAETPPGFERLHVWGLFGGACSRQSRGWCGLTLLVSRYVGVEALSTKKAEDKTQIATRTATGPGIRKPAAGAGASSLREADCDTATLRRRRSEEPGARIARRSPSTLTTCPPDEPRRSASASGACARSAGFHSGSWPSPASPMPTSAASRSGSASHRRRRCGSSLRSSVSRPCTSRAARTKPPARTAGACRSSATDTRIRRPAGGGSLRLELHQALYTHVANCGTCNASAGELHVEAPAQGAAPRGQFSLGRSSKPARPLAGSDLALSLYWVDGWKGAVREGACSRQR